MTERVSADTILIVDEIRRETAASGIGMDARFRLDGEQLPDPPDPMWKFDRHLEVLYRGPEADPSALTRGLEGRIGADPGS